MNRIFTILTFSFLFGFLTAQPTVDGDMSDAGYTTIGTANGNNGFGDDNCLGVMKIYADGTTLYVGITGELTSDDNIILFFNFSGYNGRDAGLILQAGNTGVFASSGLDGAAMDFDTDFALAFNEGNSGTNFFTDAARYGTGGFFTDGFLGNTSSQSGGTGTFNAGAVFGGTGNITIAYHNGFNGDANKGVEFSIPIAAFAGVNNTQTVQLFAYISSSAGFASNECIPGDPGGSNPGNDVNWNTIVVDDFFTAAQSLPVDLVSFRGLNAGKMIKLSWTTASEFNNDFFTIEKSPDNNNWTNIGKVAGRGNSYEISNYEFTDNQPFDGLNYYRLKQTDFDGNYEYSDVVSVNFNQQNDFDIYPNPVFNELTVIFDSTNEEGLTAEIYSATGQTVEKISVKPNQSKLQLDVSHLAKGSYTLMIKDLRSGVTGIQKFVK